MDKVEYKLCPKCGTESGGDASFCIKCGFNLEHEPVKIHVENGLYFKRDEDSKVMTFDRVPANFTAVGPVFGRVTFNNRINEDYSLHLEALMNKLQEVINTNDLDGVANIKVEAFNTVVSDVVSVTMIASGDGIKVRR
ncbi:MAG: zinc ribbon domain-containing protein [Lactobacillus sp.]|nr:MAG: zinc ribbon domain-containing protein [Lactobacillus sp.]